MKGYVTNITEAARENNDFRRVLYTSQYSQLVLMSLLPGEDIGAEVHDLDQFLRVESGEGRAMIDGNEHPVGEGSALVVPAGADHNIVNTSETEPLKLYTVYSPPEHRDGTIHATKAEAEADDEHFDGLTTEMEQSA